MLRGKKEQRGSSLLNNKICGLFSFEFLGEGNGVTQKGIRDIHTQLGHLAFSLIYKIFA